MASPGLRSSPVTGSAGCAAARVGVDGGRVAEPEEPPVPEPAAVDGVVEALLDPPAAEPELAGAPAAAGAASTTIVPCMNG